ncbi:MAG: putative bifunctional diguanylate cyclase/phosphodiesterase [Burkholderiales bacterium]
MDTLGEGNLEKSGTFRRASGEEITGPHKVHAPAASEAEGSGDATLMVVNDDPAVVRLLTALLADAGYRNLVTTSEPARTVDLMREHRPDLVLLDSRLPGTGGLEILAQAQRHPELRHIPVIMLTTEADPKQRMKALELGALDMLTKPVEFSELRLRVRNTLASGRKRGSASNNDGLTGLLGRQALRDKLGTILGDCERAGEHCVLLHADMDRFKRINETFGYVAGDRILQEAASLLRQAVNDTEIAPRGRGKVRDCLVARVAGNGFAVVLAHLDPGVALQTAAQLAQKIHETFSRPMQIDGQDTYVTVSTGIAMFPNDGAHADQLLGRAETAMYEAKRSGRNGYEFFSGDLNPAAPAKVQLENDLRRALERNEFFLNYQPRIDIASNRIVGVEALIRWRHPVQGLISPVQFIPLAEEMGLITEIGRWVMLEACVQNKAWTDEGLPPIEVSVNVSGAQLRNQLIWRDVNEVLKTTRLNPGQLVLELTESMLMEDAEDNVRMLHELAQGGIKISIDDFGTGYSSLSYLGQFPLNELKIDRSFVQRIDKDGGPIISAIIAMGHALGMQVIAEGVKSEEQLKWLKARHCDQYQGYFFSRPLPPSQLAELLRANAAKPVKVRPKVSP